MLHDLTEIYALHCDPRTDVGQIALKVGPITSAVDQVNIALSGTGGHTSRPQLTQDVIGAPRGLGDNDPAVAVPPGRSAQRVSLMWGSMHSGSVANAIPAQARSWARCGHSTHPAGSWPSSSSQSWRQRSCGRSGRASPSLVTDGVPPRSTMREAYAG